MLPEGEKGMKHNHASDIFMVEPTLVPNADGIDDRTSPASTRSEEHTDTLQRPNASIGGPQQIGTCCLENLQQQHATTGVSKETLQLLLAGWSKGINIAYHSRWKQWSSWCQRRETDPISCGI